MSYQSMEEAKLRGEKENIPFWKSIQLEDAQERDVKIEDSWEKMKYMWQSMLDALDAYEPDKVSRSDNGNTNLYAYSILRCAPESLYIKMLL